MIYLLVATLLVMKGAGIGAGLDETLFRNLSLHMHHAFAWQFGLIGAAGWFVTGPAAIYLVRTRAKQPI